ncbi:ParA family protein [Leifsonia poae]|uniref:ParA family protein n=1 Tax=Leifsonia poae TaxID=110933 RepID=UPI003D66D58F
MKVVAVYSIKGGVGKTTTAINLAWTAAAKLRVLVWDLDPQGAATYLLEVKPKLKGGAEALVRGNTATGAAVRATGNKNLHVLPADDSLRELDLMFDAAKNSTHRVEKILNSVAADYDLVVLDCPPGASLVAENAVRAADLVVLPVVPAPLALRSLDQVDAIVAESAHPAPILAFLNMVDRRKVSHRYAAETLPRDRTEVVDVIVPAAIAIERMGTERAPVVAYAPRSVAAVALAELANQIIDRVKAKPAKRKH